MDFRILGRSGLRVSELCLGTMTFGSDWGWGADRDDSRRIFDAFVSAGGNFIDTANNYTDGSSEEFVGEFVAEARDRFVLATKYTLSIDADDPNAGGNHRKSLVRSLEQSLRRLRTDYVDLLWLHMHDATTPIEEAVRALDDQVRLGKVLAVGISDSPAWVVAQANTIAELRGWSPFTALQIPYNVASREPERELLPMAQALGLALTPWGVLEAGILTGKPASERRWPEDTASDTATACWPCSRRSPGNTRRRLRRSRSRGCYAGPRRPDDRPDRRRPAAGADRRQPRRARRRPRCGRDRPARRGGQAALGFPRGFLESSNVRELIYGNTFEKLAGRSRLAAERSADSRSAGARVPRPARRGDRRPLPSGRSSSPRRSSASRRPCRRRRRTAPRGRSPPSPRRGPGRLAPAARARRARRRGADGRRGRRAEPRSPSQRRGSSATRAGSPRARTARPRAERAGG